MFHFISESIIVIHNLSSLYTREAYKDNTEDFQEFLTHELLKKAKVQLIPLGINSVAEESTDILTNTLKC